MTPLRFCQWFSSSWVCTFQIFVEGLGIMGGVATCGCKSVLLYPDSVYCPLIMSPFSFAIASSLLCNKPLSLTSSLGYYSSSSWSSKYFLSITGKLERHGYASKFHRPSSRTKIGFSPSKDKDDDGENDKQQQLQEEEEEEEEDEDGDKSGLNQRRGAVPVVTVIEEALPQGNTAIISACFVGLLTGISVVLFNNTVHELRDFFWDGIPDRGASWLREEPIEVIRERVILVPVCGGLIVSMLNVLRGALEGPKEGILTSNVKAVLNQVLKAVAACFTLGTGNSLGPEGPSVEIGAAVAKGISSLFDKGGQRRLSLVAAGSAAGISSGFNAAVAGCFFAVESVLWPSSEESSLSLTNTTSMVILSAVIASVVSEIGLGSEPAFSVPEYDFRSPSELPLYLLLGILCGLVSLILTRCTSFMLVTVDNVHKNSGIPRNLFPILGGLAVGLIALAYPEILYWGFENVDILLESRPLVKGLSADLLLQLVAVKIVATSLCRASGLVGGYYAPSLFIGAATGMAYGKFVSFAVSQSNPIFHLSILEVASPQAYGLVGMAATLAGVCQVPLTAVLLLFELTQDYRIVLPLLGAVGFSSWITSGQTRRTNGRDKNKLEGRNSHATQPPENCPSNQSAERSPVSDLCELEGSLCVNGQNDDMKDLEKQILVSQAMRTRYVTILMGTLLTEAVTLMLAEKQSCAIVVDDENFLIGLLTLGEIEEFSKSPKATSKRPEELLVSEVCPSIGEKCQVSWTVTPGMSLLSAEKIMKRYDMDQLPVILERVDDNRGLPIGLLDKECIDLTFRVVATREHLS